MRPKFTEDWQFFPCTMGDGPALVSVDVGVKEVLDQLPLQMLMVTLEVKTADDSGLPSNEEFDVLGKQEDSWLKALDKTGGCMVGRVTTAGRRTTYAYTTGDQKHWDAVGDRIGKKFGYKIEVALFEDADHESYYQGLYPTDDDWCVIRDMQVINSAAEHGDVAKFPRKIDHCCYFNHADSAAEFVSAARAEGFDLADDPVEAIDDGRCQVELTHTGTLLLGELTHHTLWLSRKAQEYGGEYDGWGTSVQTEEDHE